MASKCEERAKRNREKKARKGKPALTPKRTTKTTKSRKRKVITGAAGPLRPGEVGLMGPIPGQQFSPKKHAAKPPVAKIAGVHKPAPEDAFFMAFKEAVNKVADANEWSDFLREQVSVYMQAMVGIQGYATIQESRKPLLKLNRVRVAVEQRFVWTYWKLHKNQTLPEGFIMPGMQFERFENELKRHKLQQRGA